MTLTGGAFRKIGFMPIDAKLPHGLSRSFFLPVAEALGFGESRRKCPVIEDLDWIMAGTTRALASVVSGRHFLQTIVEEVASAWERTTYFEALKSKRRLDLLREINEFVCRVTMRAVLPDRLAGIPGLDSYDVYAGDGHWHEHATHDPRRGRKGGKGEDKNHRIHVATGHVFGLNLRTKAVVHLAHCDEKTKIKEHDMGVLKRLDRNVLRQGAAKGRKVIWIWDPAGISYTQWYKWKASAGIYFLSRPKTNMIINHVADRPWDKADPINVGVERDGLLTEGPQTPIRLVVFRDPATGKQYKFITNIMDLAPGVIAQLYRMRWDIEKIFDSFKNKLMETKAWAKTTVAKSMQANFMCLATNLATLFEHQIEQEHGVSNAPEAKRRAQRREKEKTEAEKKGKELPILHQTLVRATQTSVKFIRWLLCHLWKPTSWEASLKRLRRSYATL